MAHDRIHSILLALLVALALSSPAYGFDPTNPGASLLDDCLGTFGPQETRQTLLFAQKFVQDHRQHWALYQESVVKALNSKGMGEWERAFFGSSELQLATGFFIRGFTGEGSRQLTKFFDAVEAGGQKLPEALRTEIKAALSAVVSNPDVRSCYTRVIAGFDIDSLLLLNSALYPGTNTVLGQEASLYAVRPQIKVPIEAVLLHATLGSPDTRILEIGHGGTPVMLKALEPLVPSNKVAIDFSSVPTPKVDDAAKDSGKYKFIQINEKDEAPAWQQAAAFGPYAAIFALDVFKKNDPSGYGIKFQPKEGGIAFLRRIKSMLMPGGVLVFANDYLKESYFSKEDATAAGLEIVRWNAPRNLSDSQRGILEKKYGAASAAGQLSLYVLRNGSPDMTKTQLKTSEVK